MQFHARTIEKKTSDIHAFFGVVLIIPRLPWKREGWDPRPRFSAPLAALVRYVLGHTAVLLRHCVQTTRAVDSPGSFPVSPRRIFFFSDFESALYLSVTSCSLASSLTKHGPFSATPYT